MASGDDIYDAFFSRSNVRQMVVSAMTKLTAEHNFDSVKSCLAVGPEGFFEISFVEKCAPNVTKFIAIEEDNDMAEHFKAQMRERLPDVEAVVAEGDFLSWEGPREPVDLVLMFHCLYSEDHRDPDERRSLLRNARDRWLANGGFLVVLSVGSSRSRSLGKEYEIFERFETPLTPWEDIEADILDIGFVKRRVHEVQFTRDFSNPDEAYLRFYQANVTKPVTLDDIRSAMKELYPEGKNIEGFNTLALYQKAP